MVAALDRFRHPAELDHFDALRPLLEQRLERAPHRALDDARALGVRMHAVGDVQSGNARDAVEIERA